MEDLNVQTIAIPVEEYKELLQKQAELSLIYHKGAGGSVYNIGNFVLDLMLAVHPELITKQEGYRAGRTCLPSSARPRSGPARW